MQCSDLFFVGCSLCFFQWAGFAFSSSTIYGCTHGLVEANLMEENCFSLAKRTDVTLAMHIAINQLSRYRTRWNPGIHIFLGFEAIMLCNCMNIYIYIHIYTYIYIIYIQDSGKYQQKGFSRKVMCHMCPVAARIPCQRGLLYIYIYIQFCGWLSHFARSIVATCTINITILNSNQCWILLAFYECTKTHQPNGVGLFEIIVSQNQPGSHFFLLQIAFFTWRVGPNGSRVSLELRCQVRPGGSCLPQPTSRDVMIQSYTETRSSFFFFFMCLGALRKNVISGPVSIIETWNRQFYTSCLSQCQPICKNNYIWGHIWWYHMLKCKIL